MRLNDPILINYPVRIREVLLSIIIILVVLFYVAPRFLSEVSAQEATEDFIIETIDIPPPEDVVQQKPNRPAIPEPVDDTDDEEIEEFEDTDFSKFGDEVERKRNQATEPSRYVIPNNIIGYSLDNVKRKLRKAGFLVGRVDTIYNNSYLEETVFEIYYESYNDQKIEIYEGSMFTVPIRTNIVITLPNYE